MTFESKTTRNQVDFFRRPMSEVKRHVDEHGFALVPGCISAETLALLEKAIDSHEHGIRNLLSNDTVRVVAATRYEGRPPPS